MTTATASVMEKGTHGEQRQGSVTMDDTKSTTAGSWVVLKRHERLIYFILGAGTGRIKIGQSGLPHRRLIEMQSHSPDLLVMLGMIKCDRNGALEKELHVRFADHRSHGEWFNPTSDLLDLIRAESTMIQPPEPEPTVRRDGWTPQLVAALRAQYHDKHNCYPEEHRSRSKGKEN